MKTVTQWKDIEQYHAKCVCQTCTCHKHKCPASEVLRPLSSIIFLSMACPLTRRNITSTPLTPGASLPQRVTPFSFSR